MKISGFTFVRNAQKLYFPIKEAIASILPIVDEFVVALGKSDDDDFTEQEILSLSSDKIKIIHRIWDERLYKNGKIFAHETNIALSACTGDWCFYLQADEVIHEQDLKLIKEACLFYLPQNEIDGFTLKYYHFFGDYYHYLPFHGWCRSEIRIIRNHTNIYSYNDANTFRKNNNQKLSIIELPAYVYHYGYVRPPHVMKQKKIVQDNIHAGLASHQHDHYDSFCYGNMSKVPIFKGTHPSVMNTRIMQMSWANELSFKPIKLNRHKMKHEQLKYKIITWIENTFFNGKQLFGYKNWISKGKFKK
ncbi:MAG: hypothetical protein N2449_00185 [Bacteroidales bacterium]|nr:hypothetical protein [Bacteroidales bacterium]